ncbi:hypothetical protein H1R20_g4010, partial [Candolleomyces eurysporus]
MYMALTAGNDWQPIEEEDVGNSGEVDDDKEPEDGERKADLAPLSGPRFASSVVLARTRQPYYPRAIEVLAQTIGMPHFTEAFLDYVFRARFPTQEPPEDLHGDCPDKATGMWVVEREEEDDGKGKIHLPLQVISLATIVRGAHLLPVYGDGYLPEDFDYTDSLEAFQSFYVNQYIDHHAHELVSGYSVA